MSIHKKLLLSITKHLRLPQRPKQLCYIRRLDTALEAVLQWLVLEALYTPLALPFTIAPFSTDSSLIRLFIGAKLNYITGVIYDRINRDKIDEKLGFPERRFPQKRGLLPSPMEEGREGARTTRKTAE